MALCTLVFFNSFSFLFSFFKFNLFLSHSPSLVAPFTTSILVVRLFILSLYAINMGLQRIFLSW